MGQLFLWTKKVDDTMRGEFEDRFGFQIPETMLELYENLPEEFYEFLGFFRVGEVISEEHRPSMMMPGLVPFGREQEGDMYCFYLPWRGVDGRVPIGIWMQETNHFLPITHSMKAFFVWWLGKELIDSVGSEDWDEIRKILELFQGSCGLDEFDLMTTPPSTALMWQNNVLAMDSEAVFPLVYSAMNQYAVHGFDMSFQYLETAARTLPMFGAPSLWTARLHAMRGQITQAHHAYFRHLRTPMFVNGYHYWWHAGDLQIPEMSEPEAVQFFDMAEVPPPAEIREHPKTQFLREADPGSYRARLKLAAELDARGDYAGALVEIENAFFLQAWDDDAAREMLERLLCIYPEHNRIREAEQCRRALARLRHRSSIL